MQIKCERCGVVGINFPKGWAKEEAEQHRAKHRTLGVNGHVGDVIVRAEPDENIGALKAFTVKRKGN